MVFLDDTFRDPKSKASAVNAFCREEGIEDMLFRLVRDSAAGITDRNSYASAACAPVYGFTAPNQHHSTCFGRVKGIADEVVQNLPDVIFETADWLNGLVLLAKSDS